MEVPNKLKQIYRHFAKHTNQRQHNKNVKLPTDLIWFMSERMHIWEKRYKGNPPPFTTDETLQKYRFCNIERELDRQTIEIHSGLNYLRDNFPQWLLNITFNRFVCNPETIKKAGLLDFEANRNKKVYNNLVNLPQTQIRNTIHISYKYHSKIQVFYKRKVLLLLFARGDARYFKNHNSF